MEENTFSNFESSDGHDILKVEIQVRLVEGDKR